MSGGKIIGIGANEWNGSNGWNEWGCLGCFNGILLYFCAILRTRNRSQIGANGAFLTFKIADEELFLIRRIHRPCQLVTCKVLLHLLAFSAIDIGQQQLFWFSLRLCFKLTPHGQGVCETKKPASPLQPSFGENPAAVTAEKKLKFRPHIVNAPCIDEEILRVRSSALTSCCPVMGVD